MQRMNKKLIILLCLMFWNFSFFGNIGNMFSERECGFCLSAQPNDSDQNTLPVVGVFPVRSKSEEIPSEINSSIHEVLLLTIKFMGMYEAKEKERVEGVSLPYLKKTSEEEGMDSILFGSTQIQKNGSIRVSLKLYDRNSNQIRYEVSGIAESVFDLLETSDELVVSLVEKFSGVKVKYGRVHVSHRGLTDGMEVYIDGNRLDKNTVRIDKMVTGEHLLSVYVKKDKEGKRVKLKEKRFTVEEDSVSNVHIDIPVIERNTAQKLAELDRETSHTLSANPELEIEKRISFARSRIEKAEVIAGESSYPDSSLIVEKYTRWKSSLDRPHLSSSEPFSPREGKWESGGTSLQDFLGNSPANSKDGESENEKKRSFREILDRNEKRVAPFRTIEVDGNIEDWEGIGPLGTDVMDSSSHGNNDIKAVYMAMDKDYTYIRIDFHDSPYQGRGNYINVNVMKSREVSLILQTVYRDGSWKSRTKLYKDSNITPNYIGRSSKSGKTIESRYSNSRIMQLLDENYMVPTSGGAGAEYRQWDRIDLHGNFWIYR